MRNLILTGAAALALATVPALAQDADGAADPHAGTPAEQPAPSPQSADQANARATPAPPTVTIVPGAASGAGAVVTTYPGNDNGPPASALNKTYPVCTHELQDECQNPGEGGAPGHSRALSYWPGKPASEGGH
jgi:hypothetical protein